VIEGVSEDVMPGCRVIEVLSSYALWHWPWEKEPVFTREAYRMALQHLRDAAGSGSRTRFGLLGDGFSRSESDGPCIFRSRALALVDETSGSRAVYSVYKSR
jgi:hypothetical protein